ncbi:MAG: hypothetical protein SNF68_01740 [Rikenellaceae bacterium]
MIRQFAVVLLLALSTFVAGCSKEDDNDLVESWRGNYTEYGFNDGGEYVELTKSLIIVLRNDYTQTVQTLVYDGSEVVESASTVRHGTYSQASSKIIFYFDDCDCTTPCLCTHEDYNVEEYYYKYTYYEDEDYDEDVDDEKEDNSYSVLEIKLIDDDDPYTEWITLRYLEWVD